MDALGAEEQRVGLHDVELVEHDVEQRDESQTARFTRVVAQHGEDLSDGDLVPEPR